MTDAQRHLMNGLRKKSDLRFWKSLFRTALMVSLAESSLSGPQNHRAYIELSWMALGALIPNRNHHWCSYLATNDKKRASSFVTTKLSYVARCSQGPTKTGA